MEIHKVFDPRRYWEERLQEHPDITGVGYLGRSPRFVEMQYHARKHQVELALHHYGLTELTDRSVLDVGSGTGIWLDFWHQHKVGRMTGLDFVQPSVDTLRKQFPGDMIIQADLSVSPLPLPDTMRFDVISAFDVLLHIVDPDGFRSAIANLANHCVPGGWLIISDPLVYGHGYVPLRSYSVHNKVRSVAEYRDVLTAYGFAIDSIRPATVLLNNPLEAQNRLTFLILSTFWRVTGLWGRSNILTNLVGPIVVKVDQQACHLCSTGDAPTAKIIFARKLD